MHKHMLKWSTKSLILNSFCYSWRYLRFGYSYAFECRGLSWRHIELMLRLVQYSLKGCGRTFYNLWNVVKRKTMIDKQTIECSGSHAELQIFGNVWLGTATLHGANVTVALVHPCGQRLNYQLNLSCHWAFSAQQRLICCISMSLGSYNFF